jgi:hypothetical protein
MTPNPDRRNATRLSLHVAGYSNMDDNVFNMPGGACRGVSVRAFDPKTKTWETNWITNFKKMT